MMGHVFSAFIGKDIQIQFPFISLVVSGGHTTIYLFTSLTKCKILNQTTDDAVGETLDKIGRMLELPYPGGISIDNIYDANQNQLTLIQHYNPDESFSFSGIKTHILNLINQSKMKHKPTNKILIASSLLK
jgi:N6-L-threonylcarbamoyladenine synthase